MSAAFLHITHAFFNEKGRTINVNYQNCSLNHKSRDATETVIINSCPIVQPLMLINAPKCRLIGQKGAH
jgi:hypothetical protein